MYTLLVYLHGNTSPVKLRFDTPEDRNSVVDSIQAGMQANALLNVRMSSDGVIQYVLRISEIAAIVIV